jgi:hypothetical protein
MALTYEIEAPEVGQTTCKVTFINDEPSITHIRYIKAEFDGNGMYLPDPTLEIIRQLGNGISAKIAKGVIQPTPNTEEEEE